MKKRYIIISAAVLLAALLALGGVAMAKYISTLRDETATLENDYFYFRSNVLADTDATPTFEVMGKSTDFILVNAQDALTVSTRDISYTLTYSVLVSGEGEPEVWQEKTDMTATATLAGGTYSTRDVTVSPILWDRDGDGTEELYGDVLVEARATSPYAKTLRARFCFVHMPMTLSYAYDRDFGVMTVTVLTNDDAGEYLISWTPGLLPDNADPSGVLTHASGTTCVCGACGHVYDAAVGDPDNGAAPGIKLEFLPSSYTCSACGADKSAFRGQHTATLAKSTLYQLYFFVPAEARPEIDAVVDNLIENGGDEALLQLLQQSVTVTRTVNNGEG